MPARQIENVGYVEQRIAEIFGATHVEHRLAEKAGHEFHMFSNAEAIYTACHIATGRHEEFEFYLALAQLWNCKAQMAIEGDSRFVERISRRTRHFAKDLQARVVDGKHGSAIVLDRAYVEGVGGDENAAEILVGKPLFGENNTVIPCTFDDKLRYLAIVSMPKGERDEMHVLNIASMVSYDFGLEAGGPKKTPPHSEKAVAYDKASE